MRRLFKSTLLFAVGLLILAVPCIFLFDLEGWMVAWLDTRRETEPTLLASVIFIALAVDIFLPVPASGVITIAGDSLGIFGGVVVCWAGMCVAAILGYWTSRWAGASFTKRMANQDDVDQVQQWQDQFGALVLMLLRPIPVLAEASVLVAGLYKMSFKKFLAATSFANLVMVVVFCLLGHLAGESDWLLTALILSLLAPLAGLFFVRRLLMQKNVDVKP